MYFQVAFNILIPENLAALFDTFLQIIFLRSVKPKCSNCCSIDLPRHCVPQIVTETIWLTKRVNSCPTKEIWVKRLNAKGQITTFWMHYFFLWFFSLIGKNEIRNGVNMVVGSSPLNDLWGRWGAIKIVCFSSRNELIYTVKIGVRYIGHH